MKYILDTNIFNRVLDGRFVLSALPAESLFVATTVQLEELRKTRDPLRRVALIRIFEDVRPELVSPSFAFDVAGAGLDEGSFRQSDGAVRLHADLDARKSKFNNWHDALIAEVALLHGYGLVTTDRVLAAVATQHGLAVQHVTA